jgi:hypothetical protein
MDSISNEPSRLDANRIGTTLVTTRQTTPATVSLKVEFRSSREHEVLVFETGKVRGRKRVPNSGTRDESTGNLMDEGAVEGDHILPFPSIHLSKTCATSLAGPSGSTSYSFRTTIPIKLSRQLTYSHVPKGGEFVQAL